MKWAMLGTLLVCVSGFGQVSEPNFPEIGFEFPMSPPPQASGDEKTRQDALQALTLPERDARLMELGVPSRIIGGERWFDFRGIEVRKGDLTAQSNLTTICWDYARFTDIDLSGANLNRALLRNARLENVNLTGANLGSARLQGADFARCNLRETQFMVSYIGGGTRFNECILDDARFDNCHVDEGLMFSGGSMLRAVFVNVSLPNGKFIGVDLTGASFVGANLTRVDFHGATLANIDLTGATLVETKFRSAKVRGPLRFFLSRIAGIYLGDFDISKVDVSHAKWIEGDYVLGEEREGDALMKEGGSIADAQHLYAQAETIYRTLAEKCREAGNMADYLDLRYRALEARRKLARTGEGRGLTFQNVWLPVSRSLDGYGTKPATLARNVCATLFLFSMIYFIGWFRRGQAWFRWYRAVPVGMGFLKGDGAKFAEILDNPTPVKFIESRHGSGKITGLFKLYLIALSLSIEASFMFAEKWISMPNIIDLFRKQDERPVPFGVARQLFGIQALFGLVFFVLAGRMILLVVGAY